jgi:hypothetical protein
VNKTLVKNILIAVLVPSVISVGYFGTIYLLRKNKEKKILDEVTKKILSDKTKLEGGNEELISNWKKTLSSMKTDDFNPFYDYFMATIPNEKKNEINISVISEKGLKAIKEKEIEKLFEDLKKI